MNKIKGISLVLALVLIGFVLPAHAGISFTIGVGDYYSPVGDYDYLPTAQTQDLIQGLSTSLP